MEHGDRLAEFLRLYNSGQTSALVHRRKELFELASQSRSWDAKSRLRTKALAAEPALLMLEIDGAARLLDPYAKNLNGKLRVDTTELEADKGYAYERGQLLLQLTSLSYRVRDFREAARLIGKSQRAFESADDDGPEILLAMQETAYWRARIEWRLDGDLRDQRGGRNKSEQIEEGLLEIVRSLIPLYDSTRPGFLGRINLIHALALGHLASLEWNRGRHDAARRRIYRALFLLRDRSFLEGGGPEGTGVNDELRVAHSLWVASRIEGSESVDGHFSWGIHMAQQAERIFRSLGHPFEARATLQRLRLQIKDKGWSDAQVERELDALHITVSDPHERRFVEAERTLTRIWIEERKARERTNSWEDVLQLAQTLMADAELLPPRLRIEAVMHLGLAKSKIAGQVVEGRGLLMNALLDAHARRRHKIVIGCHLALAESYLECVDRDQEEPATARKHLREARELSEVTTTVYLKSWLERLSGRANTSVSIKMDRPFREVKRSLEHAYAMYHEQLSEGDAKKLKESTGLSLPTFYRYRRQDRDRAV